jgi:NAD(P)-dependent dehydrogenase (short-subunit alcohol dehydrogenase family)
MSSAEMKRVVLVTGGGRGIGRAVALGFAKEDARVAILARSSGELQQTLKEIEAAGADGLALSVDVTDYAAVTDAYEQIVDRLGPVDVLVNNAAVGGSIAPLWEQDPVDWWRTVEVNLAGTFIPTRVVLPAMVERGSGWIVNVSSNAGAYRWPNLSSYAVSKAAVIKLTENLATETRSHGISVFAIHPGTVNVGPTKALLEADVPEGSPAAKAKAWFAGQIERGEDVAPEVAAALICKLASGEADALSGRYIAVSDDLEDLIARAEDVRRGEHHVLKLTALPE